jgi:hypothetical protein
LSLVRGPYAAETLAAAALQGAMLARIQQFPHEAQRNNSHVAKVLPACPALALRRLPL